MVNGKRKEWKAKKNKNNGQREVAKLVAKGCIEKGGGGGLCKGDEWCRERARTLWVAGLLGGREGGNYNTPIQTHIPSPNTKSLVRALKAVMVTSITVCSLFPPPPDVCLSSSPKVLNVSLLASLRLSLSSRPFWAEISLSFALFLSLWSGLSSPPKVMGLSLSSHSSEDEN